VKIIVTGAGRVGSTIAIHLAAEGNDVAVIDKRAEAFDRFLESFTGPKLKGMAFDRHVLEEAGIEKADAFIAVTNGDNSNIVAARVAKEFYRVPKVIARIYDPRRADIYRRLGIPTVATVAWTVGKVRDLLSHSAYEEEASFGSGEVLLIRTELPLHLSGRTAGHFHARGEIRAVEITRGGRALIPEAGTVFAEGDVVRFVVQRDALGRLDDFLGRG
jgi:trk/ktr system potassium uptake protein